MHKDMIALLDMVCVLDVPWSNARSNPLQDILKWLKGSGIGNASVVAHSSLLRPGNKIGSHAFPNGTVLKNGQSIQINYSNLVISSQ